MAEAILFIAVTVALLWAFDPDLRRIVREWWRR